MTLDNNHTWYIPSPLFCLFVKEMGTRKMKYNPSFLFSGGEYSTNNSKHCAFHSSQISLPAYLSRYLSTILSYAQTPFPLVTLSRHRIHWNCTILHTTLIFAKGLSRLIPYSDSDPNSQRCFFASTVWITVLLFLNLYECYFCCHCETFISRNVYIYWIIQCDNLFNIIVPKRMAKMLLTRRRKRNVIGHRKRKGRLQDFIDL